MINTGAYVNPNEWKIPDDQVEYDEYIKTLDKVIQNRTDCTITEQSFANNELYKMKSAVFSE